MCEAAAFAAASVRPALMTMIGLVSATSRAADRNDRGVADRFHVDEDAARARVVAEVVDQVAPADVEHRADRDEGAEADVLAQAPVEHGRAERAALAEEGDVAGPRHGAGEGGVEAGQRVHHAEAVRADDAHSGRGALLPGPGAPARRPPRPISLKPAEMMIAPADAGRARTRAITAGTAAAGVTMTARSTGSGTAAMLG